MTHEDEELRQLVQNGTLADAAAVTAMRATLWHARVQAWLEASQIVDGEVRRHVVEELADLKLIEADFMERFRRDQRPRTRRPPKRPKRDNTCEGP